MKCSAPTRKSVELTITCCNNKSRVRGNSGLPLKLKCFKDGQDKSKHKWTVRKDGTPPSNDSSACTIDDLASELAELKTKVAKQELQIKELTKIVDHLRTVCSAKEPIGYVERTAKRTVEVALPSSSNTNGNRYPKRQRASSVRSNSYHDKRSRTPSRNLTPSPTKLNTTAKLSSRKCGRPLQERAFSPLLPPSSSRSPEKRSSFLTAMSTKMLASNESESDES
ncbi:hypothetical protein RvY_05939-1 [Ramazzottius varieornatus]|uniref:Uncharacterized protein n=1 Tax=Ramazzottius varieornatus TaxID=947166 RepID=A0A1D1V6E8_RAMVA|nr:hypothetical protein RvY_05939-1 [Ramazzottius varieornatus]